MGKDVPPFPNDLLKTKHVKQFMIHFSVVCAGDAISQPANSARVCAK
jgi:hypothetical protein